MIRRMTAADAGAVADIWLAANLDAHGTRYLRVITGGAAIAPCARP